MISVIFWKISLKLYLNRELGLKLKNLDIFEMSSSEAVKENKEFEKASMKFKSPQHSQTQKLDYMVTYIIVWENFNIYCDL